MTTPKHGQKRVKVSHIWRATFACLLALTVLGSAQSSHARLADTYIEDLPAFSTGVLATAQEGSTQYYLLTDRRYDPQTTFSDGRVMPNRMFPEGTAACADGWAEQFGSLYAPDTYQYCFHIPADGVSTLDMFNGELLLSDYIVGIHNEGKNLRYSVNAKFNDPATPLPDGVEAEVKLWARDAANSSWQAVENGSVVDAGTYDAVRGFSGVKVTLDWFSENRDSVIDLTQGFNVSVKQEDRL